MQITRDSLLNNGFQVDYEIPDNGISYLQRRVDNWHIRYEMSNEKIILNIYADGGYDYSGSFDISHFTTIEQIENLVNAMKGLPVNKE